MHPDTLEYILREHELWLAESPEGKQAYLRDQDLRGADMYLANLSYADLSGANLQCAGLRGANLEGANLSFADLRGALIDDVNFHRAKMEGVKMYQYQVDKSALTKSQRDVIIICNIAND